MKQKRRFPDSTDSEFSASLTQHSSSRQAERKAQQLCRQVQRALNLAFASSGDDLGGLFVDEVLPAPDCGHLLVEVYVPAGQMVADALAALRAATPRLRSEVAMSISRKRAPELSFAPLTEAGRHD